MVIATERVREFSEKIRTIDTLGVRQKDTGPKEYEEEGLVCTHHKTSVIKPEASIRETVEKASKKVVKIYHDAVSHIKEMETHVRLVELVMREFRIVPEIKTTGRIEGGQGVFGFLSVFIFLLNFHKLYYNYENK